MSSIEKNEVLQKEENPARKQKYTVGDLITGRVSVEDARKSISFVDEAEKCITVNLKKKEKRQTRKLDLLQLGKKGERISFFDEDDPFR